MRFPTVPGLVEGVTFKLPMEATMRGRTMQITIKCDAAAIKRDSFTVTTLQKKTQPPQPPEANGGEGGGDEGGGDEGGSGEGDQAPIESIRKPPVPINVAHSRLAALGYASGAAAPNGDCYPLSVLAAMGDITEAEAINPTPETNQKVLTLRKAGVDLIAGTEAIGGIDAAVFRVGEKLPADARRAEAAMKAWRKLGHWRATQQEYKTPPYMFGVAVSVKRPIVVLERHGEAYLNPAPIYGAVDEEGTLRHIPARGNEPETIQSYHHIEFDALMETLQSSAAPVLIEFDGVNHYSPFLHRPNSPTEPEDDAIKEAMAVEDANDEGAPAEGWADPAQVRAMGQELDADAVQDSIRHSHIETGMSGAIAAPLIAEGSLAASAAQQLAEGRSASPGEGEATIESQHAAMAVEVEAVEAVEDAAVEEEAMAEAVAEAVVAIAAEIPVANVARRPPKRKADDPAKAAEREEKAAKKAAEKVAAKEAKEAAAREAKAAKAAKRKTPTRSGKMRAATRPAVVEDANSDDEMEGIGPVRAAEAVPPPHKEASLEECLSGHFSHLEPIHVAPDWLVAALEGDASQLHSRLVAFHWEGWGWSAGRVGGTTSPDSNCSVLYAGKWRENHALLIADYGAGDKYGSWVLLAAVRPPSPILGFSNGKYRKQRGSSGVWMRAEDLPHHSGSELAAARQKVAAAKMETSQAAAEAELEDGGFDVGDRVFAQGHAPEGETAWFQAIILAKRNRFPPLKIRYVKTLDGNSNPLSLPMPTHAYVVAAIVRSNAPA